MLKDLESDVAKISKKLVQMTAQLDNMQGSIKEEETKKAQAFKSISDIESAIVKREKDKQKRSAQNEAKMAEYAQLQQDLADRERRREAVSLGMSESQVRITPITKTKQNTHGSTSNSSMDPCSPFRAVRTRLLLISCVSWRATRRQPPPSFSRRP